MNAALWLNLALIAYFLSAAAFTVLIIRQNKKAGWWANWLIFAGFVLQTLSLTLGVIRLGQLPVLDISGALSFFGWALAGVYLLTFLKFRQSALGALAAPLAVLLILLSLFTSTGQVSPGPVLRSLWLTFHLATIFGGYAFFGLAFAAGIMYLIQEKQIKSKRTGAIYRRLPSLNVLDNLNYTCITLGFPLITLGLVSGMAYAQNTLGTYWRWDPKEVWSLIVWLFYAALLHQRLTVGWRGRRAAMLAIIGFSVLCFTFFGVSFLLPGYHSFENLKLLQQP